MTTVSRASGGARIRRHENDSRPWREALPQRVRWSRTPTAGGVTPKAAACRAISRSIAVRARGLSQRLEERRGRPPVAARQADDELVLLGAADALDRRPPRAGARRHDPEPVQVAAEPQRRAVAQAAARGEVLPVAGLAREVPAEPRLALAEERLDVALRCSPSRAAPRPGP